MWNFHFHYCLYKHRSQCVVHTRTHAHTRMHAFFTCLSLINNYMSVQKNKTKLDPCAIAIHNWIWCGVSSHCMRETICKHMVFIRELFDLSRDSVPSLSLKRVNSFVIAVDPIMFFIVIASERSECSFKPISSYDHFNYGVPDRRINCPNRL